MKDISQPVFWLDVRKEYIIQNFDKMLTYLELYNYSKDCENGDFDKTFVCLRDFVSEIFSEIKDSNLCRILKYKDLDEQLLIRIIAAYLLVCHKIGIQDVKSLSLLANRLLLLDVLNLNNIVEKLYALQFNCICGRSVLKYGFTWSDIKNDGESFSLNMFCFNLSNTEFCTDGEVNLYFENNGLACIEDNKLSILPMNYNEYSKKNYQTLFKLCDNTEVCVDKKNKLKTDTFAKLVENNSIIMSLQNAVKPSPKKILKTYDVNDSQNDIVVKVTSIDIFIHVRTVDPAYKVIEGSVYIPNLIYDLSSDYLKANLKTGDIIKVRLQDNPKIPFVMAETFEKYYEETAEDSMFTTIKAIFYNDYKMGRRWLTENGLFVNIMDYKRDENVQAFVDDGTPISIKMSEGKYDKNGKYVINGSYELYSLSNDEYDSSFNFRENARKTFLEGFLEWSRLDYTFTEEDDVNIIEDTGCLLPLAYIFYKRANLGYISTMKRYENLMAARIIAQICGSEQDNQYIGHEMNYINNIVRFAQGDNPNDLSLTHDECIEDNADVKLKENIVSELKGYEDNSAAFRLQNVDNDENILTRLHDLVEASNILINKISGQELNRIKKNIATALGVGDMFKNDENDATYYGEENDSLEFKSSIVFPPVNKRNNQNVPSELTRQKWEILKAVCGFLNSMSGGEILLGVRDDGYSCGLKDDIEYLYKNGKIAEQSMDKFMLYVKYAVDCAFCDDCGIASESKDVTHARVRYIAERNKEDNDVLHIQVSPYEYGVVEFKDKSLLPEGMSSSYQRSSNTTAALTADTKRQLREKKLSERADADTQKILDLQKAKKNRKMVTLKGYVSRSGKKDRNVEPYKILLDRKAVICYDVDKKKPREYKITRFEEVVITNKNWKNYREKYENLHVDLFDMLEGDETPVNIVLKLGSLPYNLLLEECNGAEQYIRKNTDGDNKDYPWILDTEIYNICGIGRFYIGLAYYIKIEKGEELKAYVRDYIDNIKL